MWDVTVGPEEEKHGTKISTHTSRVGCDRVANDGYSYFFLFLLTHPVWDVTKILAESDNLNLISTHTSRVGCDIFGIEIFDNI